MQLGKRVFLFIAVNLLICLTISLILNVFDVRPYLTARGLDYEQLFLFCLVWGMGGAFISLGLSKILAKWMMGVKLIDPETRDPDLRSIVQKVYSLARSANLSKMPEIGIYNSPEVNAFATGPSRNNSLVAISSGLLTRMNASEIEGVLGHEISHIANGDMVTMTLIQGVMNAFVMFFARVVSFAITSAMRGDRDEGPSRLVQFGLTFLFEMIFGLLGSIVVASFSRYREYRADSGSAKIAGRDKMVSSLEALRRLTGVSEVEAAHPSMASLKISNRPSGFFALLSTHPTLESRIQRLRNA